ncbi:MAG TPA: DinB family protein [Phototrophicaceae bacterium]|jgi:uncharacterized damage-inducible protein DinB|nr:DinB family protein [Phototrophicaceae bacterium]
MNIDYIRTIIDHNYTRHRQLWDSVMTLTDEQYVQPVDYSLGSVRNHMVHLASVDQRWISRINGVSTSDAPTVPDRLRFEAFPTRQSARQKWDEVENRVIQTVMDLDDEALDRVIQFEVRRDSGVTIQARNTVWQILAHIVNHGTDHRAQVLAILHQMGAPTFEQDLMIYLWDNQDN